MTVQEIKTYALLLCGLREIPDSYVLQYINQSMDSLATKYDSAGKKVITNIIGTENAWTDLPADCIAVKRCFKDDNNYVNDEFLVENNQIQFTIPGTYKTEYITTQTRVTALTDIPIINMLYHESLSYGVAFREITRIFLLEDMIEGNNKFMLLQEFNRKSAEANTKLTSMKHSRKRMKYAPFM